MSKKIIIGIGITAVIIALLVGIYFIQVYKPAIQEKKQLIGRFSEFESQYQEKKAQGYDVSAAGSFARKARRAFDSKDYKMANGFLNNAFEALEKAEKIPAMPETVKEEAMERLSRVQVASVYQRVTDGMEGRDVDDVVNLFKETKIDFIFRGWWRWRPCPESPETASERALEEGYTYEHLREAVAEIKEEMPDIIFCGSIPAQRLDSVVTNPITGETLTEEDTMKMAVDPRKWGIDISMEEAQRDLRIKAGFPNDKNAYYPDITNPDFQDLLLSWAKKQIDCGADAIWIDMIFTQARVFEKLTGDSDHPAVKESYEAASEVVDEIHKYGYSRYGKYIYVGTWAAGSIDLPYPPSNLDFITLTISPDEILNRNLNETNWAETISMIREKMGAIPIFAFIDWAGDGAPTSVFSQKLDKEEQKEMLKKMDAFFQSKGLNFIYPIHGGAMGQSARILSFGKYNKYDSLAPEFETYETIKELAQSKSK